MTEYYSEKVSVCVSMWGREEGHAVAGILLYLCSPSCPPSLLPLSLPPSPPSVPFIMHILFFSAGAEESHC